VTGRACRFGSVDDLQRGRSHGRRISVVSCRAVRGCRTRPRAGLLSSDKRLTLRALPVDPSAIHIVVTVAGSSETPTARALADTSVVAFAFALSASSAARRLCLCLPALQQAPVQKGTTVSSPAAGRSTPRKCGADHARIAGHGRVGLRVASARDSGRPLVNVSSRPASAGAGAGEAAGNCAAARIAARPRGRDTDAGLPAGGPGAAFLRPHRVDRRAAFLVSLLCSCMIGVRV
jgi:hypothetical protein